jgi:hypothetical protein
MSDLNLLAILENIDKLDAAKSNEFLRDLCKQAAKEITELNTLRLRREKPAAWINFNAATGERNVSFVCESELASIPLWPEPSCEQGVNKWNRSTRENEPRGSLGTHHPFGPDAMSVACGSPAPSPALWCGNWNGMAKGS